MKHFHFDFRHVAGQIKPLHGVGQPPLLGTDTKLFSYLQEAGIPYSRLHDVGGWFGGNLWVDIPNIFRDFHADETNPANYDFTFTDRLIQALLQNGCKPYFRLGVSIENFHKIKSYRIFPPEDNAKFARICERIVRHYNEGWAEGFHFAIEYWEIWNEPDNSHLIEENEMWKGSPEQYFALYGTVARHLKNCFGDTIKVGGYGSCGFYALVDDEVSGAAAMGTAEGLNGWQARIAGFMTFFKRFIKTVRENGLPLDFFSFHSYASVADTLKMEDYVENYLRANGLSGTEIHLNEWNTNPTAHERGKSVAAANTAAMMLGMQNTENALMCYYDAGVSVLPYGGLFHPLTLKPFCTYEALKAFGNLYALKNQVEAVGSDQAVFCVAATDGKKQAAMFSNIGEADRVSTDLPEGMTAYLIDETHLFEKVPLDPRLFWIEKNQVVYFEQTT
ncbi:MAG: hypothetical protein IJT66_05025 [Clostridia bacterium]|nr:hypothetical protein [Clostridia bacterium]